MVISLDEEATLCWDGCQLKPMVELENMEGESSTLSSLSSYNQDQCVNC